ncbi:hypothetical protein [Micromonospora ureilytica]|uniref:hypothetical protein n=1 Tax=Micromonospora ureilytica TaxID=709868 RepID=UPI00403A3CE3
MVSLVGAGDHRMPTGDRPTATAMHGGPRLGFPPERPSLAGEGGGTLVEMSRPDGDAVALLAARG